jgi:putative oxidoreductase
VPRIVAGILMTGHGLQKLAGWFGGRGVTGTASLLESLDIRPARRWAIVVGLAEAVGGLLMALGLLEPIGQLLVASVLVTAMARVHWSRGLWTANGGLEFPLVMLVIALVSATAPVGASVDAAFDIAVPAWLSLVVGTGCVVGIVAANAAARLGSASHSARSLAVSRARVVVRRRIARIGH